MRYSLKETSPLCAFEDMAQLTFDALGGVKDFRKSKGRQLELKGTLALVVLGLAAGKNSLAQIAAFGKRREDDLIPFLGLTRAPSHATVWRVVNGIDPEAIRDVLMKVGGEMLSGRLDVAVAVDGKSMRGSRTVGRHQTDIVMAVEHATGIVLDAVEVQRGSSELVAGRKMIRRIAKNPQVAVVTGDALYADRATARSVTSAGKDYAFKLKKESA